jgi:hypothetical protein
LPSGRHRGIAGEELVQIPQMKQEALKAEVLHVRKECRVRDVEADLRGLLRVGDDDRMARYHHSSDDVPEGPTTARSGRFACVKS